MILQLPLNNHEVVVLFRLPAQIWANSVHLVGDFNSWSTSATPMRRGEQYWEARLRLRAGERYFYAYLIDDTDWCSELPGDVVGVTPPVTMLPVDIPQATRLVGGY
jgi:1,4-alpha-glucan branching enzyme